MTVAKSNQVRKYHSPARSAAAAETRERVVAASGACFTRSGYAATTMKAIASEAGVSVETVNNLGPKRALLFAAFDRAFAGAEGRPMTDRPEVLAALAIDDPDEFMAAVTRAVTGAFADAHGIWRAVTAAADVDADVASALQQLLLRRHGEVLGMLQLYRERGGDLPGDIDRVGAIINHIVSFEAHWHFVEVSGWTLAEYQDWALSAVRAALA